MPITKETPTPIPTISMEKTTTQIIRKSIHTFLKNYQYFTSTPTFIALPFSISLLISQSLISPSSPLPQTVSNRVFSILTAATFPHFHPFFALLAFKLSQTISTFILTLPFSLSFLLLSKASIFHFFLTKNKNNQGFLTLYQTLTKTHISNSFIIFAANSTCFSLFFLAFTFVKTRVLVFTILSLILYSIVLGNAIVVCNLALASSALESNKQHNYKTSSSGFYSILKAFIRIKGKTTTALALAVPMNLGMAAIEALFHYRIVKSRDSNLWLMAVEGVFIAYLYSVLLVIDVIISSFFYQHCMNDLFRQDHDEDIVDEGFEDEELLWYYDHVGIEKLKEFEEFL